MYSRVKTIMNKQYKRSKTNRFIFGICGGLAEHTNTDVKLWRIIFILLIMSPFPIGLLYLLITITTTD